jgi:hypothetical protein
MLRPGVRRRCRPETNPNKGEKARLSDAEWGNERKARQGCVGSDAGTEGAFRTLTKKVSGVNWWWDWGTSACGRKKRVLRGDGDNQQVKGRGTLQGMNGVRGVETVAAPQTAKPTWEPCSGSHYR